MQNIRCIKARNYKSSDIRVEGNPGRTRGGVLVGETDVDEGGECLAGVLVLRGVEEVVETGEVVRVPGFDVEFVGGGEGGEGGGGVGDGVARGGTWGCFVGGSGGGVRVGVVEVHVVICHCREWGRDDCSKM